MEDLDLPGMCPPSWWYDEERRDRQGRGCLTCVAAALVLVVVVVLALLLVGAASAATTYEFPSEAESSLFKSVGEKDCLRPVYPEISVTGNEKTSEATGAALLLLMEGECEAKRFGIEGETEVRLKDSVEANTTAVKEVKTVMVEVKAAVAALETKVGEAGYSSGKPLYVSGVGGGSGGEVSLSTAAQSQLDGDTEAVEVPLWTIIGGVAGLFIVLLF
ncbi:MAG: hypothetical protein WAU69_01740, partial [Solirubrobacteraceae bacterium]